MRNPPRTFEEAKRYRYGKWVGDEKGIAYQEGFCAYSIWPKDSWVSRQCQRRNGHGVAGLYCAQHARKVKS